MLRASARACAQVVRQSLCVPPNERSEQDVVVIMDMIKNKGFFREMEDEVKSILAKVRAAAARGRRRRRRRRRRSARRRLTAPPRR